MLASWLPCSFLTRDRGDPRPGAGTRGCQESGACSTASVEQVPAPQWQTLPGKTTWNDAHHAWIAQQTFADGEQYVLSDGLAAVEGATLRASQLTARLREVTAGWSQEPLVKALQAMRGVEFVTAVTLVAEVGDFRRFAKAADFMGYVGLIPSEQTSGNHRRQGPITKTGNAHVRHVLVDVVALPAAASDEQGVARAQRGISPQICAIAWKARSGSRPAQSVDRPGQEQGRSGDGRGAELAGFVSAIAGVSMLSVNEGSQPWIR